MKRLTAKSLVKDRLDHTHLSQNRVDTAVDTAQKAGWTFCYHPCSKAPQQTVVAVRAGDPLEPILRLTHDASNDSRRDAATVPRAMIEGRLGLSIRESHSGTLLGRRGLLIAAVDEHTVSLIGNEPDLSLLVNSTRYGESKRGRLASTVIRAALDLDQTPCRLTNQRREQAAFILSWYDVDSSDLMLNSNRVYLSSRWRIV